MKIVSWANGQQLAAPDLLALWAAILSIILKEVVYQYSIAKANQLNSPAVKANAWHHRSDALSSIGTAIGIGGAILLGERWTVLDPIASIAVGALIVKVAVDLLKNGMDELMEKSLPEEVENEILDIVRHVPGVKEPHDLCTRRIGNHYAIEMHILMDGDIPLKEAHDKATEMERLLKERYGEETHISIHVEPGDIYAFIGHNGAGKTTLLKAITGIHEFDKGSVTIDGINLKEDPQEVKRRIGSAFRRPAAGNKDG